METKEKKVTKADLAFIDAAIQLHIAGIAGKNVNQGYVNASNPAACDVIDVVAVVAAVAAAVYHWYNSSLIGEDGSAVEMASRINLAPNVSLERLITAREGLASELGAKSLEFRLEK